MTYKTSFKIKERTHVKAGEIDIDKILQHSTKNNNYCIFSNME